MPTITDKGLVQTIDIGRAVQPPLGEQIGKTQIQEYLSISDQAVSDLTVGTTGSPFIIIQRVVSGSTVGSWQWAMDSSNNLTLDRIAGTGNYIWNELGASVDYRFEGDTDTELLFLDGSENRVGFSTTTPATLVDIAGTLTATTILATSNDSGAIGASGTGFSDLFLASGAVINFSAGDVTITHASSKITLGGGNLSVQDGFGMVVGHTGLVTAAGVTAEFQVLGTGNSDASFLVGRWSEDANEPHLRFYKSRHGTIGSNSAVTTGDQVGAIKAFGDDGTDAATLSSAIIFDTEGTIGTGQVPGVIKLQTAAAGSLASVLTLDSSKVATFAGNLIVSGDGLFADQVTIGGAIEAGSIFNIEPGVASRDLLTSVGLGLNVEADSWSINAAGNGETVAIGSLAFLGIPTWTSVGTSFTVTDAATLYIQGAPVDSTNVTAGDSFSLWVDAGASRFDGDVTVGDGITLDSSVARIIVNGSDGFISSGSTGFSEAGGSIYVSSGGNCNILLDNDNNASNTSFAVFHNTTTATGTPVFVVNEAGLVVINGSTNANMAVGLTIEQFGNDNQILAFRNSDVATTLTTATNFIDVSSTDYAVWGKTDNDTGGLLTMSMGENAATSPIMLFESYGGTATTTKSTSGRSLVEFYVTEHTGSALANIADDGNIFGIRARVEAADVSRWILDEDGDTWQSGGITTVTDATIGTDLIVTDQVTIGGAIEAGSIFNIEPGVAARDLLTSVGMGLHIETDTWSINAAGNGETVAIGSLAFLGIPTWTSVGTTFTATTAATLYIEGAPVGGSNVTVATGYALWVDAGISRFDDDVLIGTTTAATGNPRLDVLSSSSYLQFRLKQTTGTTDQRSGLSFQQRDPTEEGFAGLLGFANASENRILIGGGTSLLNAATVIQFNTAASITSVTGSIAADITGVGTASIFKARGDITVDQELIVSGAATIGGAIEAGSIFNIEPGVASRDLLTSVGMGLHIETDTWSINAAGNGETVAIGSLAFLGIPTWTSVGTTFTATTAATLYIEGAPVGGSNVTVATGYALWVDNGNVKFDGDLTVDGAISLSNNVTRVGGTTTDVGTGAATSETTLHTVTVPANAMGTNGGIRIVIEGQITGSDDTKTITIKFDGTQLDTFIYAAGETGVWVITLHAFNRNAADAQAWAGTFHSTGGVGPDVIRTTTAKDTTGALDFTVTGTTPNANDEVTVSLTTMELISD